MIGAWSALAWSLPRWNRPDTMKVDMRAWKGKVQNGAVRLSPQTRLPEGQEVMIVPIRRPRRGSALPPEIEREDLEFVRACRGRLGRLLKAEDGRSTA